MTFLGTPLLNRSSSFRIWSHSLSLVQKNPASPCNRNPPIKAKGRVRYRQTNWTPFATCKEEGRKPRLRVQHKIKQHQIAAGQITIIPKPEFFGDYGRIPLLFTTIWGDQPAGKVAIICPDSCRALFFSTHFFFWKLKKDKKWSSQNNIVIIYDLMPIFVKPLWNKNFLPHPIVLGCKGCKPLQGIRKGLPTKKSPCWASLTLLHSCLWRALKFKNLKPTKNASGAIDPSKHKKKQLKIIGLLRGGGSLRFPNLPKRNP